MLDYWECTAGSGTYGDNDLPFNTTDKKTIPVPNDHTYSNTLTVTLAEDSAFTAHFKPAHPILLDEPAEIFPYDPASDAGSSSTKGISLSNSAKPSESVRDGNPAILAFKIKTPSNLTSPWIGTTNIMVNVYICLYKGNSTEAKDMIFNGNNDIYNVPSLSTPNGAYFYVRIPHIDIMDGFTAQVGMQSFDDAVIRYYPLTDGNGKPYILSSAVESARDTANTVLDFILEYCKTAPDYALVRSRVEAIHKAALADVAAATTAEAIDAAKFAAIGAMTGLVYADVGGGGYVAVTAAAEKFAANGGYVAEPARLVLPGDYSAAEALGALMNVAYPGGGAEEVGGDGWLFTVNNVVANDSSVKIADGDVLRWQYAKDAGGNVADLGGQANKDALTAKVAEIRAAGTQGAYGGAYDGAIAALSSLVSVQEDVDAALLALAPADVIDVIADVGGTVTIAGGGNYTVEADDGRVIDEIWIDGARIQGVQGDLSYTTAAPPARGLFATFAYTINYNSAPAHGTLGVYRGEELVRSGSIVRGGETLTVTAKPDEGWMRDRITSSAGLARIGESYSFVVTGARAPSLAATFKEREDEPDEPVVYEGALGDVLAYIETAVPVPEYASVGGDWAVVALARAGVANGGWLEGYFGNLRSYIKNPPALQTVTVDSATGAVVLDKSKYTENSRAIVGLTAAGQDASRFPSGDETVPYYDLVSALKDTERVPYQGLNGPIWALIALDSNNYLPSEIELRAHYLNYILDREKTSGGWDLLGAKTGTANADITGMALQALAPYFKMTAAEYGAKFSGTSAPGHSALRAAVTRAVSAMRTQLDEGGGFAYGSEGITSESAAQVLVALCSLGYDGTADGSFTRAVARHLLQFGMEDGSFRHQMTGMGGVTQMSTEQAAYALVAYDRYVKGEKSLYDMTGADKALLRALRDSAAALSDSLAQSGGTEAAQSLAEPLAAAEAAAADDTATQAAVDAAKDALADAMKAMTADSEAERLALIVNAAGAAKEKLAEADYTLASWKALTDALAAAQAAVAEALAEEAEAAQAQMMGAMSIPEESGETEEVSVEAAETEEIAEIEETEEPDEEQVEEIAENIEEDGENPDLSAETTGEETFALFEAQAAEASEKLAAARAATAALIDALKTLARAEIYEPPVTQADKLALNAAIELAAEKVEADYTAASWSVLETALAAARTAAADETTAQDDVDAALTALNAALTALVKNQTGPGPGPGPGETDTLATYRAAARASLDKQYGKYRQADYTDSNWQTVLAAYNKGIADIAAALPAPGTYIEDNVIKALNDALDAMRAVPSNAGGSATVAISVDAGTLGLGFIVKPTLVTVGRNSLLSYALADLITQNGYQYKNTGSIGDSSFYLAGIAPVNQKDVKIPDFIVSAVTSSGRTIMYSDRDDAMELLEEFDYVNTSGWMYSVSDGGAPIFPGVGAGAWQLGDRETIRWQFTVYGYGADLDADNSAWGAPTINPGLGDKTALTWRVAELRSQYTDAVLEKNADYNAALAALTDPAATGAQLSSALAKLNAAKFDTSPGGTETSDIKDGATPMGAMPELVEEIEVKATASAGGGATAKVSGDDVKAAISAAADSGSTAIAVTVTDAADAKSITGVIPKSSVGEIKDADLQLVVKTDLGAVALSQGALGALSAAEGEDVSITVSADNSTIDLTIAVGDAPIAALGGTATVSLPYTPDSELAADDYDLLTVYYIAEDGSMTEMKGARYDAATGSSTFVTEHLGKFKVSEWISPFDDIAKGEWYYKAARFAYSNDLITGTTATTFAPQTTLTRAMLITVLARDAGIDTSGGDTWYSKAAAWGMETGLTDGTNMDGEITREQFATLLYRYRQFTMQNSQSTIAADAADISAYTDAGDVSEWAREAMEWAVGSGLVTGRTATTLAPRGTATRAEAAMLLQRYLENMG